MWHETHRELPGRFVVKIGCTRVLKNSKSSDGGGGAGCCINIAAIGTKAKIGMTVSPFCPLLRMSDVIVSATADFYATSSAAAAAECRHG